MRPRSIALLLVSLIALMLLPAVAWADGFSMPQVDITAEVQTDGTLRVTERRTFSFDNDVNGVFWTIPLGANQQGGATSLTVTGMSEESGSETSEFRRDDTALSGDRGVDSVSDDSGSITLKVYSPHEDGDTATYTLSYTFIGAVMGWADTAELYWKFIGDEWDEDSQNVTLAVTFAGAASLGVAATTGDDSANLRAWGHGPLNGNVSLDTAANSVSYTVPWVQSGEFAEARVAFPMAWVPGLTASSSSRLPTILSEEEQWASEANARRARARTITGIATVASIVVPAIFLAIMVLIKRRTKKPVPVFDETYFRDLPSDDHPAVIAAFMNDGSVGNEALVSTLMKLTDDRVVAISKTSETRRGIFGNKTEEDYLLAVEKEKRDALTDDIDRKALRVYFGKKNQISFSDMAEDAKEHKTSYADRWDTFVVTVTARFEERNLVADTGRGKAAATMFVAGLLITGCVVALVLSENPVIFAGIALSIAGGIIGMTFHRYTQEGAELRARCVALKRWFEDFTRLGEAAPGDVVLWNKLLVLAVALGVSDRVLEELAAATPREFEDDYVGGYYYPAWWWVRSHGSLGSPANTLNTVSPLSLAQIASSSDSSGGGFGGGFSGGGGGGAGGGGGGTF